MQSPCGCFHCIEMSSTAKQISLNGLFLDYPDSGTWTYTQNLVRSLDQASSSYRFKLWTRRTLPNRTLTGQTAVKQLHLPVPGAGRTWYDRFDKLAWETILWPLASARSDLMHSLYFAAPIWSPQPLVVTVHDIISLRTEFSHGAAARRYASLMRSNVKRANALITVSHFAKQEIVAALDYPPEKVWVTYEAPDPSLCRVESDAALQTAISKYRLPQRFVLYLGGTERRKNIETLVRVWSLEPRPDICLVIVGSFRGGSDPLFPDIPELTRSLGLSEMVHFVPRVDSLDLATIYSLARAFCFPSTYEGFGLPPVEAMACGTPVICSNATSLREIVGEGAELLPPHDLQAWHDAVIRTQEDSSWLNALAAKGLARVKDFSWEQTARETIKVYDQVLKT